MSDERAEELAASLERSFDAEILERYLAAVSKAGRQAEAIRHLKGLYERRRIEPIYEALRRLCTFPEFSALPPPDQTPMRDAARVPMGMSVIPRGPFVPMLRGVFAYPFSTRAAAAVIAIGAVFFALGFWLAGRAGALGLPFLVLVLGYEFGFFFEVMRMSGLGTRDAPDWQDFTGPWECVRDLTHWVMAILAAGVPALAAVAVWRWSGSPAALWGSLALGLLGVLYLPMALMLAGFLKTWSAPFSYLLGLRSIVRLGGDYLVAAAFFGLTYAVGVGLAMAVEAVADLTSLTAAAGAVVATAVTLTMHVVQMRALGLLFYAREKDMEWF